MLAETQLIEKSWKRCRELGYKPEETKKTNILPNRKVLTLLNENPYLKEVAVPILEQIYPFLTETGHYASLVNKEGVILFTVGDPSFEQAAHHIQMEVGANWREQEMGTNAMGIVLIEKRPVKVHGDQHFYIGTRFLTCAASPIFSPSGELCGAINISGNKEAYHPYIPLLTELLTNHINKEIIRKNLEQNYRVTLAEMDYVYNHFVSDPIVCLDEHDRIIRVNTPAARTIGPHQIGKSLEVSMDIHKKILQDPDSSVKRSVISLKLEKSQSLHTFDTIFSKDSKVEELKRVAKKVAKSNLTVLILGESGTGKELFAQAIHTESFRRNQPFLAINCGAIPDTLIESELFGYEPGSFTGGNREGKKGIFEAAKNGTVFLDEIGEMSQKAQTTLLRVLQERRVMRIGGTQSYPINVRIIAATNQNLPSQMEQHHFRSDLFYRLREFILHLPPLKARTDQIELAFHLIHNMGLMGADLSEDAKTKLLAYSWPGNIRELQSLLKEAAFYADGGLIQAKHLILSNDLGHDTYDFLPQTPGQSSKPNSIEDVEKQAILQALQTTKGNITQTAKLLKISRNTLYRKLETYNLQI